MKPFKEENTAYCIVFLSDIFQLVLAVGRIIYSAYNFVNNAAISEY